ncbi:MAG TPA: hypothetical protein VL175_14200 [Pirellulales bacterium]|jgi:hypothetical protein|nr:hypothetical protein [Pirellulales bacterium]
MAGLVFAIAVEPAWPAAGANGPADALAAANSAHVTETRNTFDIISPSKQVKQSNRLNLGAHRERQVDRTLKKPENGR